MKSFVSITPPPPLASAGNWPRKWKDLASFCYQCGACVGDCPATTYSQEFNPREIMLKVLYGLGDELLGGHRPLAVHELLQLHERVRSRSNRSSSSFRSEHVGRWDVYPETVSRVIKSSRPPGARLPRVPGSTSNRGARFGLAQPGGRWEEIQALLTESRSRRLRISRDCEAAARADRETGASPFSRLPDPDSHPAMEFPSARDAQARHRAVDWRELMLARIPIYSSPRIKCPGSPWRQRNYARRRRASMFITNCSGCTATLSETRHLLEDESLRNG